MSTPDNNNRRFGKTPIKREITYQIGRKKGTIHIPNENKNDNKEPTASSLTKLTKRSWKEIGYAYLSSIWREAPLPGSTTLKIGLFALPVFSFVLLVLLVYILRQL